MLCTGIHVRRFNNIIVLTRILRFFLIRATAIYVDDIYIYIYIYMIYTRKVVRVAGADDQIGS